MSKQHHDNLNHNNLQTVFFCRQRERGLGTYSHISFSSAEAMRWGGGFRGGTTCNEGVVRQTYPHGTRLAYLGWRLTCIHTLPTRQQRRDTKKPCHPTSQSTLSYFILPHYLVLPCPTSSYSILPHPTPAYRRSGQPLRLALALRHGLVFLLKPPPPHSQ